MQDEFDIDDPWEAFLHRLKRARQQPDKEVLERVRARAGWPEREATMSLYQGLLLVELGHLSLDELKSSLEPTEEAARSIRDERKAHGPN
jgi:hypothetical protein